MNHPILTLSKLVEELVKNIPSDTRDFTKEMIDESDRGLALICSEALSLKLENLFRVRFTIHEKKIVDPLFQIGGPLSSFAYRISLAYSVGFIDEGLYSALERIRSIRNKFAHSSRPLRFNSPAISTIIQQFQCGQEYRDIFLQVEKFPDNVSAKKESYERWHFVGAYFHVDFALRVLLGTAPKAEYLTRELVRIKKEYDRSRSPES